VDSLEATDERGQGFAEFALILALVAVVTIAALLILGGQLTTILGPGR
jgi:Flp pilus assembly pilin Flp